MRSSNIELLRIVAMFLIVLHHFSVHGTWPESGSIPLSSEAMIAALSFGGKIGVDVFVLITGYFMMTSKFRLKSLLRVILETLFYSYALVILFGFITPENMSAGRLHKALMPVVSGEYWFITNFIALMLVSPLLNALYKRIGNNGLSKAIAIGFVMLSVLPTVTTFDPLASNFLWFIFLYLLGGWVRVARGRQRRAEFLDPLWYAQKCGGFVLAFVSIAFCLATVAFIMFLKRKYGFGLFSPTHFVGQNMIPALLAGVGLLVGFSKLELGSVKIINEVAKTTLGIYLIHDNPFVRLWLWRMFAPIAALSWGEIALWGLISAAAVFCVCSAIDYSRIRILEAPLMSLIDRQFGGAIGKADAWFNSLSESGASQVSTASARTEK